MSGRQSEATCNEIKAAWRHGSGPSMEQFYVYIWIPTTYRNLMGNPLVEFVPRRQDALKIHNMALPG